MSASHTLPSYAELRRFAQSITNVRDRLLVLLVLETSSKVGRLRGLRFRDVLSSRTGLKISEELLRAIRAYRDSEDFSVDSFIFAGRQSAQMTIRRLDQIVQEHTRDFFGFSISIEQLRFVSLGHSPSGEVNRRKYLGEGAVARIRESAGNDRNLLLLDLLLAGIGSGAICALRVNAIDSLQVGDLLRNRLYRFCVERGLKGSDFVFTTRQQTHLTKERIFQIVVGLGAGIGLTISPRVLNHSFFAAWLFDRTGSFVERRKGQGIVVYQEIA